MGSQQKHILIIAGEPSGDLNAASLVSAIKAIDPGISFSGIGGERMRQSGVTTDVDIKDLSVIGLFDVLKKLPQFIALKKLILQKIGERKPDAVIFVDFSGFNLRVAKAINNRVPTIYYICPQVWASRPGRIKSIRRYITKRIVLFPFEKEFYAKHGLDADYAGHPLLDVVKAHSPKEAFLKSHGLTADQKTILLMPGSRISELKHILPVMVASSELIQKGLPHAQFIIAKPKSIDAAVYNNLLRQSKIDFKIVENNAYNCLNAADFCLVASGTATLETTIMQKPFVIIYKVPALTYWLYRPMIRVPFIGLVNIVAGKRIVPEFIQKNARPKPIADYILYTLNNPSRLQEITAELARVKLLLGEPGASARAARIVVDFLNK